MNARLIDFLTVVFFAAMVIAFLLAFILDSDALVILAGVFFFITFMLVGPIPAGAMNHPPRYPRHHV